MNQLFPLGSVWITPLAVKSCPNHDFEFLLQKHRLGDFGKIGERTRGENIAHAEIIGGRENGRSNTQHKIISCYDSVATGYEIIITTYNLNEVTETFITRSDERSMSALASS